MNIRQKSLLKKLSSESVKSDWEKAFGGKSYGNRHLFRVNKIIRCLLKKEKADEFICLAGGWIHDVSLSVGNDDNPQSVKTISEDFLKQIPGLTEGEIQKIAECASGHEVGQGKLSLEAKIVHDADVIDKSGFLGLIRHIWKLTNLIEKRELKTIADLRLIKSHLKERQSKTFNKSAQKIVEIQNKNLWNFLKDESTGVNIMKTISHEAMKGIISDKIAGDLITRLTPDYQKPLINQLECRFINY